MDLTEITGKYILSEGLPYCQPVTRGHINDTMILKYADNDKFILQRINDKVFNAEQLMHNIMLVTEFIRHKAEERGGNPDKECLTIVKTKDGKPFVHTSDGYFRIYRYIEGVSYQAVEKEEDFYKCAQAFGSFANSLAEFDATQLFEVIPKFHDTEKRFRDFLSSLEKDVCGRAKDVQKEINFVLERKNYCNRITSLLHDGTIPVRCTHNDTKLNNVIFDEITGESLAVVDLDTVMPGSICYDFGDAIRFGCNTAKEDEIVLSLVHFDINLFRAFVKGYLSSIGNGITDIERKNLAFSAILMTYECGMRFLTDHLNGDKYFRITRENHNLDRARTQFKLIEEMEKLLPEMEKIVEDNK